MPHKHLNLMQDLNLGSPRLPVLLVEVLNNIKQRSPHDAFVYKFQSISKKCLIFVLSQQLYIWLGMPMTLKNCPKLIDLYLCGKIKKKQFLRYLFQPKAIFKGFKYKTNNKGQKNQYLNQKLEKIVTYFQKHEEQLQQERKMIREIFNDFNFVLPYAYWFHVYANKCQSQKPQIQQLDEQFMRIHKVKFSHYIAKIKHLDMKPLCEPFLQGIKQRQLEKLNNISEQERKFFLEIKEKQKHLTVKYKNNNLQKFEIRCSADSKNLLLDQKEELMKHLMKYHQQILALTDQQSTNSVLRRYQEQAQAPVNVPRRRSPRNQPDVEQGEIQVQRSRSPQRKEQNKQNKQQSLQIPLQIFEEVEKDEFSLMVIEQKNSDPILSLLDQLSNEKQSLSVYQKMCPGWGLHLKYPDQLDFPFQGFNRQQNNKHYFFQLFGQDIEQQ